MEEPPLWISDIPYRMTVHPPRHRWNRWRVTVDSGRGMECIGGAMFTARGHTEAEALIVAKNWCDLDARPYQPPTGQIEYQPMSYDEPLAPDYDG